MAVKGLTSLKRKVRHMRDDLGDEVEDAVRRGSESTAAEMRGNVVDQNAVWKTNLFRSISAEKVPGDSFARFEVSADVPYAAFVEFGTGAKSDPSAPHRFRFSAPEHTPRLTREITEWVMTKPAFFGPRTEEVAWAIAVSISQEGTSASPFLRPAWFVHKPLIIRDSKLAVKRVIRRA